MDEKKVYAMTSIFFDIEGDSENVMLQLPPEILEEAGFNEGDTISVDQRDDGSLSLKKVDNTNES